MWWWIYGFITENMQDILQTFKISDFEIDRDSKISQRFLAACMRFQRVAGPSVFDNRVYCRWTAFRIIYHLTLVVYLTCLTILPLTRLSLNILNHYMLSKTKLELLKRTLLNSVTRLTGFKLEWFFLNFLLFWYYKMKKIRNTIW